MFDKPIVPPAIPFAERGALRAPCWGEIVGRLAAAQDLRFALSSRDRHAHGNFDRFAQRGGEPHGYGERSINLDDLAHGKGRESRDVVAADGAVAGDRETR